MVIQLITAILAALFCYAALSKLLHYQQSEHEMLNQVFTREMALTLVWLIPVTELIIACMLVLAKTQRFGLWAATLLLLAFSLYLAFANNGLLGRTPCSCGGILKKMDYQTHLLFNLCFVTLGCWGILLSCGHISVFRWFKLTKGGNGRT